MTQKPFPGVDRRKFEAESPNDMWQSDVMHGPKLEIGGERRRKTYLIAFIDDHSRLITHGQFYISTTNAEGLPKRHNAVDQTFYNTIKPKKQNSFAYKEQCVYCPLIWIHVHHILS